MASAAYRSAERLHDQRLDRDHDFTNKSGVVHSEVMLPDGAPERLGDRSALWNEVETTELRKDAQLSREIEFAIPRELNQQQGIDLARDFVQAEFVDRGMIADVNLHWDVGADGLAKPHAHVMLTMREVDDEGFGAKVRDWNCTELVEQWRERWADHVNERLASLDIDAQIDHRSLHDQGIDLEPQNKIGPAASRMAEHGLQAERLIKHHEIACTNAERIIADPNIALDAITRQQATFTNRDLAMFVHRHSDGKDQFDQAMGAVQSSPDMIALGKDGRGEDRFTSRDMIEVENRLHRSTKLMAERERHRVSDRDKVRAQTNAEARGLSLSGEQRAAFDYATDGKDLGVVIGYAGTGKSAMLGVARDVLVIDEAGMIGSRQMERVLSAADEAGAKVVLVGDPEQLQAIEAGAAFRSIAEQHGGVEITEIRRQQTDWQRDATRQLATGRTGEALDAYRENGMLHAAETREAARGQLIDTWDRERAANPDQSRIILTHTNDDVQNLNELARGKLRDAGELGKDITIQTERGKRQFATGDRLMFLRNDRDLGVKNGSLGTVAQISPQRIVIMLDDGRNVSLDTKVYADVDHGYAATIHKSQGVTVDRTHVLATPGLDRHASYVALSRHREGVQVHFGRDDFASGGQLVRTLSRERSKDMASDYARERGIDPAHSFAERRGISFRERIAEVVRKIVPEKARSIFANFRPPLEQHPAITPALERGKASPHDIGRGVERFARALADINRMRDQGLVPMPHQESARDKAFNAFNQLQSKAGHDIDTAFSRQPELVAEAANGRTSNAIRAMQLESEIRTNPLMRADRFVENWQKLYYERQHAYQHGGPGEYHQITQHMGKMTDDIGRDAQLESLLRNRAKELGIKMTLGRDISQDLANSIGLGRGRGLGIGM